MIICATDGLSLPLEPTPSLSPVATRNKNGETEYSTSILRLTVRHKLLSMTITTCRWFYLMNKGKKENWTEMESSSRNQKKKTDYIKNVSQESAVFIASEHSFRNVKTTCRSDRKPAPWYINHKICLFSFIYIWIMVFPSTEIPKVKFLFSVMTCQGPPLNLIAHIR